MEALNALLEVEAEENAWRIYVADIGCMLVRQRSKRIKLPFYSEMIDRQRSAYDSRTGQEILDSTIAKLRKNISQRAVNEDETV